MLNIVQECSGALMEVVVIIVHMTSLMVLKESVKGKLGCIGKDGVINVCLVLVIQGGGDIIGPCGKFR